MDKDIKFAGEEKPKHDDYGNPIINTTHKTLRMKREIIEKMMRDNELLEKLAEIEHLQWETWSKSIAEKTLGSIKMHLENHDTKAALREIEFKFQNWQEYWKPYNQLGEMTQELDRVWARKVYEKIMEVLLK